MFRPGLVLNHTTKLSMMKSSRLPLLSSSDRIRSTLFSRRTRGSISITLPFHSARVRIAVGVVTKSPPAEILSFLQHLREVGQLGRRDRRNGAKSGGYELSC